MRRVDNTDSPVAVKALIYGDPGTGKTSMGVTAPKPLILLSEAQGELHIKAAAKRLGIREPPTLLIESTADMKAVTLALEGPRDEPLRVRGWAKDDAGVTVPGDVEYELEWPETVVLDSLTDMSRIVFEAMKRQKKMVADDGTPTMRFWGLYQDAMSNTIKRFRNLPLHVLFLCLADDREAGDENHKVRVVAPEFPTRKLQGRIAAAVNVVGVSRRRRDGDKLVYNVMTAGEECYMGKPYRPLQDTEEPDFTSWVTRIQESAKVEPVAGDTQPDELKEAANG